MRKEEKDLWLKALKEQLDDYSEPIPASGWNRLEQSLNATTPKKIIPFRKWAYIGIAATIALLFGIGSLFMIDSITESEEIQMGQKVVSDLEPDRLPVSSEPMDLSTITSPIESKEVLARVEDSKGKQPIKSELPYSLPIIKEAEEEVPGEYDEDHPFQMADNASNEEMKSTDEEIKTSDSSSKRDKTYQRSSSDKLHIPVSSTKRERKGWSMGISGGSAGLMANSDGSPNGMIQMSTMLTNDQLRQLEEGSITLPIKEKVVVISGVPYRLSSNVVEYKHHQPVSVGFSIRKYLTEKLSLSTGLMYTYLSSDMKVIEEGGDYEMTQKFHYLGIPIKVNYDFYQYKSFQLYASAGGSIERAVYGKQGNNKVTNNRFQFAVSGAVGAQINLNRRVGFYVEPGVAYYFKDGSDFETIRSDRPFNFDINAGIRLTY